jgi:Outer membrane protein beta-barrel domain
MSKLASVGCFSLFCIGTLSAQEVSHFSFELGAGFVQTVGNTGTYLNDGWLIQGGAGYNFSSRIGVLGEVGYTQMGFNGTTLANVGYPNGGVNVFSATVDPIVHLLPKSRFDVYAIGGGGLYHWNENFSAPTGTVTPFATGSFPLVIPNSGDAYSENKPGFNIGMGVALGTKWHGKLFAEARYTHIFLNNNQYGSYVPVTFGFRW